MKKQVIAGAIILGLGAVTIALAQPGTGPATPRPASANESTPRSADNSQSDRSELHGKVARFAPRSSCSNCSMIWPRNGSRSA